MHAIVSHIVSAFPSIIHPSNALYAAQTEDGENVLHQDTLRVGVVFSYPYVSLKFAKFILDLGC